MSNIIGSIIAKLGLDTSDFKKEVSDSGSILDNLKGRMSGIGSTMAGVAGGLGIFELVKGLGEGIKGAIEGALESATNLVAESERLGTSTDFLQGWSGAAEDFGISTEQATKALDHLQKTQGDAMNGNEEAIASFKRIGVEYEDAAHHARPLESVILDTNAALQDITEPGARASAVMDLYGTRAGRVVDILSQRPTAFADAIERASKVTKENTEAMAKANSEAHSFFRTVGAAFGNFIGDQLRQSERAGNEVAREIRADYGKPGEPAAPDDSLVPKAPAAPKKSKVELADAQTDAAAAAIDAKIAEKDKTLADQIADVKDERTKVLNDAHDLSLDGEDRAKLLKEYGQLGEKLHSLTEQLAKSDQHAGDRASKEQDRTSRIKEIRDASDAKILRDAKPLDAQRADLVNDRSKALSDSNNSSLTDEERERAAEKYSQLGGEIARLTQEIAKKAEEETKEPDQKRHAIENVPTSDTIAQLANNVDARSSVGTTDDAVRSRVWALKGLDNQGMAPGQADAAAAAKESITVLQGILTQAEATVAQLKTLTG